MSLKNNLPLYLNKLLQLSLSLAIATFVSLLISFKSQLDTRLINTLNQTVSQLNRIESLFSHLQDNLATLLKDPETIQLLKLSSSKDPQYPALFNSSSILLAQMMRFNPEILSLKLINSNNQSRLSIDRDKKTQTVTIINPLQVLGATQKDTLYPPPSLSDRDFTIGHFFLEPTLNSNNSRLLIPMSISILDEDKTVIGKLEVLIDGFRLTEHLQNLSQGPSRQVYAYLPQGELIYSSQSSLKPESIDNIFTRSQSLLKTNNNIDDDLISHYIYDNSFHNHDPMLILAIKLDQPTFTNFIKQNLSRYVAKYIKS